MKLEQQCDVVSSHISKTVIKKILRSVDFKKILKRNKKLRGRDFLEGKISRDELVVLRYATRVSASRSIMEVKYDYLRDKPLKPLLKWPGGKKSELKLLRENYAELFPKVIDNYYEPFLGGGAVWLAINPSHKSIVNDFSKDLIDFYSLIKEQDKDFFSYIDKMSLTWDLLQSIASKHADEIYKRDFTNLQTFKNAIQKLSLDGKDVFSILFKILISKLSRISNLEKKKKSLLNKADRIDNIESALKAGYYTYVRAIYNSSNVKKSLHSAAFYFIRDYCFSSMFRFNDKGEFNVPYGGITYNSRSPSSKISQLQSKEIVAQLNNTQLENLDFEKFLDKYSPTKKDWMFIDPPYDTEFSTYDKNEFNRKDQERLAGYLINKTEAQFMAVMKNTKFIFDLYQGHEDKNIRCLTFDKNYSVSFKNRNDQEVEHLVVYRSY